MRPHSRFGCTARFICAFLFGISLTGCELVGQRGERQYDFSGLDQTIWHADMVAGVDIPEPVLEEIRFLTLGDLRAGGTDGCNQFGFEFEELDRYTIRVKSFSATEKACTFESAFMPLAQEDISVEISGGRMTLSTSEISLHLRSDHRLPIAGTSILGVWHAPDDAYGEPINWTTEDRPRLEFSDDGRFEIQWECQSDVFCNTKTGYFGLGEDGKVDFYTSGRSGVGSATQIPGFGQIRYYAVEDDTLQLMTEDREVTQRFVR